MGETRPRLMFTLWVLLAINTMNFYDRQVLGVVAEPVRNELGLNDTAYGWLTPAFVVLYAVMGIPLGLWADVGRRTRILALGVAVWSLLTACSGLAWSFWSLFVMRLGVGIGEAACAPAANSLLGDLFPRQRRAWAISVFMIGLPVGLGLSSVVSGALAHSWGWRAAFFVACLPGLGLALLCLCVPEPARGAAEEYAIGASRRQGSPLLAVLKIPTLWWIILTGALHNFNMYAIGAFLSPFLQRYHGLSTAGAGWVSGLIYGCGGLGIFLGGWVCDRAGRRRVRGRLEVSALALAVGVPCFFVALRQPPGDVGGVIAWLLPACLLFYVYYSGVYAAIQDIVEPARRGTAMAVYFFAMYLLAAFGPVITGAVSDYFARQAAATDPAARVALPAASATSVALGATPLGAGPVSAVSAIRAGRTREITEGYKAIGLHKALYLIPALGVILVLALFIASRTVLRDYQKLQQWCEARAAQGKPPA
jgi:MFS family permease